MIPSSAAVLIQHLLFLFLVLIAPVWDYFDTRRLKLHPGPGRKVRYYQSLCAGLWLGAAIACFAVGGRELFTIHPLLADAPWLFGRVWVQVLVLAVVSLFAALMLLPYVVVLRKKWKKEPRKWSSAAAFKPLSFFLPATWEERRWFAFLCVTAGICEEVLFRGFLLHYLNVFPLSLSLTVALLLAAVIFGLQHLYQGLAGAASTAVIGLLLGLLFLLSGNLLLPMLLHAIMDLRILIILPPPGTVPDIPA